VVKKIKNKRTARGPRRWSSSLAVTAEVAPGHVCTHVYVCVHHPFAGDLEFLFSIITIIIIITAKTSNEEYVMKIRRFFDWRTFIIWLLLLLLLLSSWIYYYNNNIIIMHCDFELRGEL